MGITKEKLFEEVIEKLGITKMHPLHRAILEESCESVIQNDSEIKDIENMKTAVQIAFVTTNSTLKSTLKATLDAQKADQIDLNYRNQSFVITKDSPLLN